MNSTNYSFCDSQSQFSIDDRRSSRISKQDRFIPRRDYNITDLTNYDTPEKAPKDDTKSKKSEMPKRSIPIFDSNSPESSVKRRYSKIIKHNLVKRTRARGSILSFADDVRHSSMGHGPPDLCKFISALDLDFDEMECIFNRERPLPPKPFKILDAPEMEDDFYKRLMDWCPKKNRIAIGLSNMVYLWDAETRRASQLCEFYEHEELCSLVWSACGKRLAFGMESGEVKIWDVKSNQAMRNLNDHDAKVGVVKWHENNLFSGSKDKQIKWRDPRQPSSTLRELKTHTRQVLNVAHSPFGVPHLLSSGNDSKLFVHDLRNTESPIFQGGHDGPIRGIDWNPHRKGIFASGGGSTDKTLKRWNVNTRKLCDQVFTSGQICDLRYSRLEKEIFVGQGGDSNSITVWADKNLQKLGALKGHKMRVLNLEMSPDGTCLASLSPDETLRFWKIGEIGRKRSKTANPPLPKFSMPFGLR